MQKPLMGYKDFEGETAKTQGNSELLLAQIQKFAIPHLLNCIMFDTSYYKGRMTLSHYMVVKWLLFRLDALL